MEPEGSLPHWQVLATCCCPSARSIQSMPAYPTQGISSVPKWVLVTTACRVLMLQREKTASRCGGVLQIYWIRCRGQPTMCGPPARGLGEGLAAPRRRNVRCYGTFQNISSFPVRGPVCNWSWLRPAVLSLRSCAKCCRTVNRDWQDSDRVQHVMERYSYRH
jgi:hypothetical protein